MNSTYGHFGAYGYAYNALHLTGYGSATETTEHTVTVEDGGGWTFLVRSNGRMEIIGYPPGYEYTLGRIYKPGDASYTVIAARLNDQSPLVKEMLGDYWPGDAAAATALATTPATSPDKVPPAPDEKPFNWAVPIGVGLGAIGLLVGIWAFTDFGK